MNSAYRLRVKLGDVEFEAEGEESAVLREFQVFREIASGVVVSPAKVQNTNGNGASAETQESLEAGDFSKLFARDEARNLVSLRFLPQGEDRLPTSMLLILYGFKQIAAVEDVPVTQLKAALEISGLTIDRVDREAAPSLLSQGLVLKGGKGKGGRYRLTNQGVGRAEAEGRKLLGQGE